jgi:hypothetical protein
MQSWQNSLRVKINQLRLKRYWKHPGHLAAKNELREAQAWCAARADLARPKDCFRDERLRPQLLQPSRRDAVDDVRQSRNRCLYSDRHVSADLETVIAGAV